MNSFLWLYARQMFVWFWAKLCIKVQFMQAYRVHVYTRLAFAVHLIFLKILQFSAYPSEVSVSNQNKIIFSRLSRMFFIF